MVEALMLELHANRDGLKLMDGKCIGVVRWVMMGMRVGM